MKVFNILFFLCISVCVYSQKAASPYLQVLTKNTQIPLQNTEVQVNIVASIAKVSLTQTYKNTSKFPIEAIYVFPMSSSAAVHSMEFSIGSRTTKAKIFEKKKGETAYQAAIKNGQRATKLDQNRPNVFCMQVANIMPDESISVTLLYTEMLRPIDEEYQFVLPSLVGPRYTGEANKEETIYHQPYTSNKVSESHTHTIDVRIKSGTTIQHVSSSTHAIKLHYPDAKSAEIELSPANKNSSNSDFILNYSLRGSKINAGLLLYEGEKENYFSLLIEPNQKTKKVELLSREYLFVVDVSGSMMGYPIAVSKTLLRNLLSDLGEKDRFNILLFSADNAIFKPESVQASDQNISEALQFLTGTFSNYGKGTRLLNALKTGYKLPRHHPHAARSVVLITDGYINVEKKVFEFIEQRLNKANVFTFGIGSAINRYLIDGIARVSNSLSFTASSKDEAYEVAKTFKEYISTPLLTQLNIKTTGFEIYDLEPKTIPDVFSNRPILIYGKYKGLPKGHIALSGMQNSGQYHNVIQVTKAKLSKQHEGLKYLWARNRVARLMDYKRNFGAAVREEVTHLGLNYHLTTEFTSFVAVDFEVLASKGKLKQVKQPIPLPNYMPAVSVGVEAEIQGVSIFKKSYNISIKAPIPRHQKRAIKIWLKSKHSNTIRRYLKQYKCMKLFIEPCGTIVQIEKDENSTWSMVGPLKNQFTKLPKHLRSQKKIIITLKQ